MESIEASGKGVEEAIQQALIRLGKRRDEVEITVLQEPSRGAFGLESKKARVLVSVRPPVSNRGAEDTPEMADAILGAAEKPTRAVKVGVMSKVNTFVAKNMPAIGERMAAKQEKNLKRDEPPRDREGALYTPSEHTAAQAGQIHGHH